MAAENTSPSRTNRDTRLNIRTSSKQDLLIRQAAAAADKTVSEFVLDSATVAAEQILADRRYFALSPDAWEAFDAALARPAIFKPRLAALLASESVFEPGE